MDAIDLFLREQAAQGRVESEGVFTVSGERALQKLASYQLPRTSAWILKMVQAGVAGGATAIAITQSSRSTRLRFEGANLGTLRELREMWTNSVSHVTTAQKHLSVGLRTISFGRLRPVLVTLGSSEGPKQTLFWDGKSLSPVTTASSGPLQRELFGDSKLQQLSFHVGSSPLAEPTSSLKFKGINNVLASEYRELQRYAVTCPVPLRIDQRRIDHFGLQDVSLHRRALLFGCGQPAQASQPAFALSPQVAAQAGAEPDLYQSAWLISHSEKETFSRVSWIQDGAVCQEEDLPVRMGPLGLRLYLAAGDLPNDLTGLQLRFADEEQKQERISAALDQLASSVEPGSQARERLLEGYAEERSGGWLPAACFVIAGAVLAPATGGVGLLAGAAGAVVARKTAQAQISRLRGSLEVQLELWAARLRASPLRKGDHLF